MNLSKTSKRRSVLHINITMDKLVYFAAILGLNVAYEENICCFPDKWQGSEELIFGNSEKGDTDFVFGTAQVAVDATKHAVYAEEQWVINGTNMHFKLLQLFDMQKQFTLVNGQCQVQYLPTAWGPSNHCVPGTAKKMKKTTLGSGSHVLPVTEYMYDMDIQNISLTATITVTDDCIPVTVQIYGKEYDVYTMIFYMFDGITPGISDPTVFNVPAICNNQPTDQIPEKYIKMEKLVYFAAILGLCVAYEENVCCFPDKWQGTEELMIGTSNKGKTSLIFSTAQVAVDATIHAVYADEHLYMNGTNTYLKLLQLFDMQKQFTVVNGQCYVQPLPTAWGPSNHCIPGTAKKMKKTTLGSGSHVLPVSEYTYDMDILNTSMTATITVTDDCIPVTEQIYGAANDVNTMMFFMFDGITTGISDPTVFNVPAICNKQPTDQIPEKYIKAVSDRRRRSIIHA